jgi:predicted NodU family carbamoyl transferase
MTNGHVGYSVRIQTVHRETNARFDALLTLSDAFQPD